MQRRVGEAGSNRSAQQIAWATSVTEGAGLRVLNVLQEVRPHIDAFNAGTQDGCHELRPLQPTSQVVYAHVLAAAMPFQPGLL